MFRIARALSAVVVAVLIVALPASASTRLHAQPPDRSRLGQKPLVVRDTPLPPAGRHVLKRATRDAAFSGGDYPVGGGETVTVLLSPSYVPDGSVGQSWADLLASFAHNWELSSVTVILMPYNEVTAICGTEADACYDPQQEQIVLPGDDPPDGTPVEELAAHEYGHHIANNRDNTPWSAYEWGPKRWASYEGVCPRVRAGTAVPGAENPDQYGLNPGEAFAESYRVLNGGQEPWVRVDASWFPDSTDLDLIAADVNDPYAGPTTKSWGRRFRPHARARDQYVYVNTPLDGSLEVRLRGRGSLDGDLFVYDAANGNLIAKRRAYGHDETLRTTVCGPSRLVVDVFRYSGTGAYSLRVTRP
jgi:hypothetical protein